MSKIKNGGLDQYGAEPFKQQIFATTEGVNGSQAVSKNITEKLVCVRQ